MTESQTIKDTKSKIKRRCRAFLLKDGFSNVKSLDLDEEKIIFNVKTKMRPKLRMNMILEGSFSQANGKTLFDSWTEA